MMAEEEIFTDLDRRIVEYAVERGLDAERALNELLERGLEAHRTFNDETFIEMLGWAVRVGLQASRYEKILDNPSVSEWMGNIHELLDCFREKLYDMKDHPGEDE